MCIVEHSCALVYGVVVLACEHAMLKTCDVKITKLRVDNWKGDLDHLSCHMYFKLV